MAAGHRERRAWRGRPAGRDRPAWHARRRGPAAARNCACRRGRHRRERGPGDGQDGSHARGHRPRPRAERQRHRPRPDPAVRGGPVPLRVVVLAGGTGGAVLAAGIQAIAPEHVLTVIANTADDDDFWGLRVCPDIDAVIYRLAGMFNDE
ncbi:MAG: hypothetical protein E6I30_12940, partial [Chloroflexi bacterium]